SCRVRRTCSRSRARSTTWRGSRSTGYGVSRRRRSSSARRFVDTGKPPRGAEVLRGGFVRGDAGGLYLGGRRTGRFEEFGEGQVERDAPEGLGVFERLTLRGHACELRREFDDLFAELARVAAHRLLLERERVGDVDPVVRLRG